MAVSPLQRFEGALAERVEPFLGELGFTGAFPTYTRALPDRLDTVWFMIDRLSRVGIDVHQQLPDGTWPLPPEHTPLQRDKVASALKQRLGSIPAGGWLHRSTQGWIDTGRKSPALYQAVADACIARLRGEAEPWFAARPVHQVQELMTKVVPALREMGFATGDFPDFQRRLPDRADILGFYFDQAAVLVIEVAQVTGDGRERPDGFRYIHCAPEHMVFYHVSDRLRRRLQNPWPWEMPVVERALTMIRQEAEPWFRERPVYQ